MHQLHGITGRTQHEMDERLYPNRTPGSSRTSEPDVRAAEIVLDSAPVKRRLQEASDGIGLGHNGVEVLRACTESVFGIAVIIGSVLVPLLIGLPKSFAFFSAVSALWTARTWLPPRVRRIRELHRMSR